MREFLIIKRVRRFFRRSCDIRIYVLTQLLPFLYTQSRVYAEIIWRWDLCYYFDKKKANNNKKMKTKSFYFANWMKNLNLSWLIGRKLWEMEDISANMRGEKSSINALNFLMIKKTFSIFCCSILSCFDVDLFSDKVSRSLWRQQISQNY